MQRELEKISLKLVLGRCLNNFYAPNTKELLAECLFGRLAPQNAHNQKVISVVTPSGEVIGSIIGKWKDTLLKKLKRGVSWKIEKPPKYFNLWGLTDGGEYYLLPYNVPIAELPDELMLVSVEDKMESKGYVLYIVSQIGWLLEFASKELKADREIVQVAVSQEGNLLEYASNELKADPKIRTAAGL